MDNDFEKNVEYLQSITSYDEITVGCFLCNYGDNRICGAFQSSGCTDAYKCRRLMEIIKGAQYGN